MIDNGVQPKPPKIGDVFFLQSQGSGNVQSGWRPSVVFQNNTGNAHSPNLVVLPLTTRLKKREMPTHVFIPASGSGLARDSAVLCENPVCIPKGRLGRYLTHLPDAYMGQIARAHLLATSAIALLDLESPGEIWRQANRLNTAW
ncbi:MAG: type II toxin-antitoxin system PemK/MazF family toxin [Clostridiales bacterium]|nr:type II toxin-antitoxin system PemK/MazF family toxin [Clostridiales bacterium]